MTIPKGLAARAVIELDDGRKFYIDIKDGSMFVQFYTVYMVRGKGRKRPTERESFRRPKLCFQYRGSRKEI